MRAVETTMTIRYAGTMVVPAGMRVVMPDHGAVRVVEEVQRYGGSVSLSGLGQYTRHYGGQDLDGRSLCAWRGHGIGDTLVFAGLLRLLKQRWPKADIDLYVNPLNLPLWEGVPGLPFSVWPEPIAWADWVKYDWHLLGEDLCEVDKLGDQPCTWDGHLTLAGVDPRSVPPEAKLPLIPLTGADRAAAADWLQRRCIAAARPLIVWQLSSSTPIRSYPPANTRAALDLVCRTWPNAAVVVACLKAELDRYWPMAERENLWPAVGEHLRTLFALVERADLVVCPDSALGHVAAGLQRPCISLWASFDPRDRVRYYRTHRPVYRRLPCAPCRHHETTPIAIGCPLSGQNAPDPYCRGLAAISPEAVVLNMKEILPCPSRSQM